MLLIWAGVSCLFSFHKETLLCAGQRAIEVLWLCCVCNVPLLGLVCHSFALFHMDSESCLFFFHRGLPIPDKTHAWHARHAFVTSNSVQLDCYSAQALCG